jgi:hypothetical protein
MSIAGAGDAQQDDVSTAVELLINADVGELAPDVITVARNLAVQGYRDSERLRPEHRDDAVEYIEDFALSVRVTLAELRDELTA